MEGRGQKRGQVRGEGLARGTRRRWDAHGPRAPSPSLEGRSHETPTGKVSSQLQPPAAPLPPPQCPQSIWRGMRGPPSSLPIPLHALFNARLSPCKRGLCPAPSKRSRHPRPSPSGAAPPPPAAATAPGSRGPPRWRPPSPGSARASGRARARTSAVSRGAWWGWGAMFL